MIFKNRLEEIHIYLIFMTFYVTIMTFNLIIIS